MTLKHTRDDQPHWTESGSPTQEGVNRQENLLVHITKELGFENFSIARKALGNAYVVKMETEAARQIAALKKEGIRVRDGDGSIITGLLDLTKLGLNEEQAKARSEDLQNIKKTDALMRMHKELGGYYERAEERLGEDRLLAEVMNQVSTLQQKGESLRDGGEIRVGLLNLTKLGLTQAEAAARSQQFEEEKAVAVAQGTFAERIGAASGTSRGR